MLLMRRHLYGQVHPVQSMRCIVVAGFMEMPFDGFTAAVKWNPSAQLIREPHEENTVMMHSGFDEGAPESSSGNVTSRTLCHLVAPKPTFKRAGSLDNQKHLLWALDHLSGPGPVTDQVLTSDCNPLLSCLLHQVWFRSALAVESPGPRPVHL